MRKLLWVASFVVLGVAAHGQNLVTNPGFETGDTTGWTFVPASSGSDFIVAQGTGHTGNYAAGFGATAQIDDQIYQDLTTTNGGQYQVSWWSEGFTSTQEVTVQWNGTTLFQGSVPDTWTQYTFNVSATGSTSRLTIGGYNTASFSYVDDVSVTPVPEPTTMAVLGAGALALLRRRRR